jgi:hypothetical protein
MAIELIPGPAPEPEKTGKPTPPPSAESQRIIDDFLKNNPDWTAKPKDDLTIMFEKFERQCMAVRQLSAPMAMEDLSLGIVHSPVGRQQFILKIHKMFVEQFNDYGHDELLFLLAWTHAGLLAKEYV